MRLSPIFSQGDVELAEFSIGQDSPVLGMMVADLVIPDRSLFIAILRNNQVSFPRGRTVFDAGDRVFALAHREVAEDLRRAILGGLR